MKTTDKINIHFITPATPNSCKFKKKYGYIYGASGLKSRIHARININMAYITGKLTDTNG